MIRRKYYIITVDQPKEITDREMLRYLKTAIRMWSKGGRPADPLFDLEYVVIRKITTSFLEQLLYGK